MDDSIDQMNQTAKVITLFELRSFEGQMQEMGDIIVQARKTAAVRWNVASDVVLAWIVTVPAAALFGSAFYELYELLS